MSTSEWCMLMALAAIVAFGLGYSLGKTVMLDLMEDHADHGRSLDNAIDYERAVACGKIPRG